MKKPDIFNERFWLEITSPFELKNAFYSILRTAGFTIHEFTEHYFSPQGYTALWLLGESHLAVHTFPEASRTYVELSSCARAPFIKFMHEFKGSPLAESVVTNGT